MLVLYPKAVIFDLDGVITNTMPYHFRAWQVALQAQSIHISRYEIFLREGQKGIQSVREILSARGMRFSRRQALDILDKKEQIFKKIVQRRFFPGAISCIRNLYQKKFKLGLVTGTSASEVKRILPKTLSRKFSVIITADDVSRGKPHPEPYLMALQKLKLSANACVVLENAPLGIRSAKGAGISCVALSTSLPRKYLSLADVIVPSFESLNKKVRFVHQ